jgi:phosphatidate cytidylyltransferase
VVTGICASILACLILFAGKEIFDIACALFASFAVFEIYEAFRVKGFKPTYSAGFIACICMLLGSVEYWDRRVWKWLTNIILFVDIRVLLYFSLLMMFCFLILGAGKYTVADLAVTILGAFYICFLYWYLIMTRNLFKGEYAVWFVFLGAVATDTSAYFIGTYFGRHKLIPHISPKKTIEGAIGGALACVIVFILYGTLIFNRFAYQNPVWQYALMGILCGVIAQIGDLAASCIKRYCGIKDFGKIMPGHGGILDRTDSVILISPVIYILLTFMHKM